MDSTGTWVCARCAPAKQEMLGYYPDPLARRLARKADPETSKAGARDARRRLSRAQGLALESVSRHPWRTASELEAAESLLGRTVGRRLGELEQQGRIVRGPTRACRVTGRKAATWGEDFSA